MFPIRSDMSAGKLTVVYQLAEYRCRVRIDCARCKHSVVVSAAILEQMVGRLELLVNAQKRLRCTECLHKGANIGIIYPRGR